MKVKLVGSNLIVEIQVFSPPKPPRPAGTNGPTDKGTKLPLLASSGGMVPTDLTVDGKVVRVNLVASLSS